MSTVYFKRQGGGKSSDLAAKAPPTLEYGEPAVDSDGSLYIGDGHGNVVKVSTYMYTGTFKSGSWTSTNGYYTQTQTVTPVGGGPALTASAMLGIPQSTQTDNKTANENKQEALGFFAAGKCTPGNGNVTIKCWEKPVCDVDVYWEAR